MTTPEVDSRLLPALAATQRLLEQFGGRGIVIGGVAVALLAKPRFTNDVDLVMPLLEDDPLPLIEAASRCGLTPRIADTDSFARQSRVILLRHVASGIDVDISMGALPFEIEAIERGRLHETGSFPVRLPTVEDLIIMKAVAHRPLDLEDIRRLIEVNPDLDRERIQFWLEQFAAALDMPELWDDIRAWLR